MQVAMPYGRKGTTSSVVNAQSHFWETELENILQSIALFKHPGFV